MKVNIDGKEYCVETLIFENERLKKEVIASAELHKMLLNDIKQEMEQKYYKDAISRPAVLDTLDKMDKALDTDRTVENYKKLLTECYKDLPPIIPLPKPYKVESEE